ncbi:hypothetical protein DL95DRAFT_507344 [Leptodontidium sp. 2 PMI_412]|nr:hypothetical protein DL95DRAFT_507344 [Leptodontidium sp. 2 PMI_412]
MASLVPTYIPTPNRDILASSSIVVLGRMITDRKNPESQVPASTLDPPDASEIQEGEKIDWETTSDQLRSGKIGLWFKCLQFVIGGQVSSSKLKSMAEQHKFKTLETKYFLPENDPQYLKKAVSDAGIQGYFKATGIRKPVYMIVGLKTGRKASVSRRVEANIVPEGPAVTLGPGGEWKATDKRDIKYKGSSDYIFVYKLLMFKPKKKEELGASTKTVTRGAVFGIPEDVLEEAKTRNEFQDED